MVKWEVREGVWSQSEELLCGTKKSGPCPGSNEKAQKNQKQGVTWLDVPIKSAHMEDGLEER